MKKDRKKYRWKERKFRDREFKRRHGGVLKHDPCAAAPRPRESSSRRSASRRSNQTQESVKP